MNIYGSERSVDRAVLMNAGVGTRMQPACRDEGKAMFPAGRYGKVIDYLAMHVSEAGIRNMTIVEGANNAAVRAHFMPRTDGQLEYVQADPKKQGIAARMKAIDNAFGLVLDFVPQPISPYGTAVGKFVVPGNGQTQLVMNGDDLVLDSSGKGILDRYVRNWQASGADHAMLAQIVNIEDASNYGILEIEGNRLIGLEEQPEVPKTNLANVGRYIFSPNFDIILDEYMAGEPAKNGEYQLTAAIPKALEAGQSIYVEVMQPTDVFLDFGSFKKLGASISWLAEVEAGIPS